MSRRYHRVYYNLAHGIKLQRTNIAVQTRHNHAQLYSYDRRINTV